MISLLWEKGAADQAVIPAKAGIQSPTDDVRIHNQICPNSRRKLRFNGLPRSGSLLYDITGGWETKPHLEKRMAEMFDWRARLEKKERAILIGVEWTDERFGRYDAAESLEEMAALADTAGIEIVCRALQTRNAPDAATLIGKGKAEELQTLNEEVKADVFLFDGDLSPGQLRNLEAILETPVIDRSDIILDIFAQRAQTKEAMLQVEMAQLEHAASRLRRAWTHLSRVGGGSGVGGGAGTRGPGETQLSMDRRLIQRRIKQLRKELARVSRQRRVSRAGRADLFTASLVGYTNAGKSSLLNALTGETHAAAEDKLFKTLDTTTRRLQLPNGVYALLTDTVGFIRRLPHRLVTSFRATLEETSEADLLLHAVDISCSSPLQQIEAVNGVLKEIGALERPTLIVLNKMDALRDEEPLREALAAHPDAVPVSAKTGEGLERLKARIGERAAPNIQSYRIELTHEQGRLLSYLYDVGRIHQVEHHVAGVTVRASVDPRQMRPLEAYAAPMQEERRT